MTTPNATWTKLKDGTWGVRAPAGVTVGSQLTITTKAGKTSVETVAQVLWTGTAKDGQSASLVSVVRSLRREPLSVDGRTALQGQHWSSRGHGPTERLCAGGCGRRVSARYAECRSCHLESVEAM